jgi:hypothetical protein
MARHVALPPEERDAITDEVIAFLRREGISANRLAQDAGVVQPFVWSVQHRKFEKSTPRLRRLLQYIRIKSDTDGGSDEGLQASIDRYLAAGGDLALLRSSVDMLANVFEAERSGRRRGASVDAG